MSYEKKESKSLSIECISPPDEELPVSELKTPPSFQRIEIPA
jgi:hypothetical protein